MKSGGWKWLFLIAVAIAVAIAPSAANAKVAGSTLEISQEVYAPEGNPVLVANAIPVGGKPIAWQRCYPDAMTCTSLPGTDSFLEPGETQPGTRFKASISGAPDPEIVTSRTWTGKVTALTPPTITGTPAVGAIVTGAPGTWSGGWGSDRDSVTVMACRTAAAATCDVVTGAWQTGVEYLNRPIAPSYKGWLLYAVDARLSGDEVFPAMLLGKTRPNPLLQQDATEAVSAAVGPIVANASYSVSIFKRAVFSRRSVVLARTRCESGCKFKAIITIRMKRREGSSMPKKRVLTKRLRNNGRLVIRRSQIRGASSTHVTIIDRGVIVAKRSVSLKRR